MICIRQRLGCVDNSSSEGPRPATISLPITLTLRPAVYPQGPEDLFLKKRFNVLTIFFSFGFRDNVRFFRDVFHGLDRK